MDLFEDFERMINKKIISLDQRLKEVEDVKKLNKIVGRF